MRRSSPVESIFISSMTSLPFRANRTLCPASTRISLSFVLKKMESSATRMLLESFVIMSSPFLEVSPCLAAW